MTNGLTIKHGGLADGVYHIARWGLAGLFIFSGFTKLVAPDQFAVLIDAYGILPEMLVVPVAILLPAGEVIAGGCLVFNVRGSLAAITLMMVLFLAVLGYGIWMGLDVDCGCFGPEDPESRAFHGLRQAFYRDIVIMTVVAVLYVWRYRRAVRPVRFLNIL
ncbi:MAG: DoxX family membrane protein [Desulfobacterales bacterium]|nr:DoxX family membrane protein [Desulfobacterales bacterium]